MSLLTQNIMPLPILPILLRFNTALLLFHSTQINYVEWAIFNFIYTFRVFPVLLNPSFLDRLRSRNSVSFFETIHESEKKIALAVLKMTCYNDFAYGSITVFFCTEISI